MKDYYSIVPTQSSSYIKFKSGFHLQSEEDKEDERSIAESSLHYKQRIDSMFDERSVISGFSQKSQFRQKNLCQVSHSCKQEDTTYIKQTITNEVQDQINQMFQEVNLFEINKPHKKSKNHSFSVSYIGSTKLYNKISSLKELQVPLKKLYFNFLKKEFFKSSVPLNGSLEITNGGLRVKHAGHSSIPPFELLNPFPTIAVWAAVKFVFRKKNTSSDEDFEYAFMPLIADPESIDKITLYHALNTDESSTLCSWDKLENLPLFVIVIKQISKVQEFECHAFVCASSNDAIVIAANLYTALVHSMPSITKANQDQKDVNINFGSASQEDCGLTKRNQAFQVKKTCDLLPCNSSSRPPRRNKNNYSDSYSNGSAALCSSTSDENFRKCEHSIQTKNKLAKERKSFNDITIIKNENIFQENFSKASKQNFKLSHSSIKISPESQEGDILTKVAIPRSKSFLNASGPFFSRYTKGLDGLGNTSTSGRSRKTSIGSPLGLNELFQEFKQEGLYSMNDILDAIIDPDGMSFNDLKPIYKEFVMKLALTLTKDELYQRSKSIMQKQKHKRRQKKHRDNNNIKKTFTPAFDLKKALRRSVSNLKFSRYKQSSFEFTSVIFPSCGNNYVEKNYSNSGEYSMSLSVPSTIVNRNHKRPSKSHKSNGSEQKSLPSSPRSSCHRQKQLSHCTGSHPHDIMVDPHSKKNYLHNSSSGYFSCSECSFSSNSCSCSSVERCYCSLGRGDCFDYNCASDSFLIESDEYSPCECDTDSCFESDKCYCTSAIKTPSEKTMINQSHISSSTHCLSSDNPVQQPITSIRRSRSQNIFENITGACSKMHSQIQITNSLETINKDDKIDLRNLQSNKGSIKTFKPESKSSNNSVSERKNSSFKIDSGKDNEEMDYGSFNSENKVLLVSARDPTGKVVYMGSTHTGNNTTVNHAEISSVTSTEEALSVKKSAEIAALFKLSDDILYNTVEPPEDFKEKYYRRSFAESNLETSLGYLP